MKATGVIRRVDDLGRVVIPKEIRKNLRIKEGDNLEIFIDNDKLILNKYSIVNKINDLAQELVDSMHTFINSTILITDTDSVIAASGKLKKKYLNKQLSENIISSIKRRDRFLENHIKKYSFITDDVISASYVLSTIISLGEAVGMIIIIDEENSLTENELQLANVVSSFMTKYLEQ